MSTASRATMLSTTSSNFKAPKSSLYSSFTLAHVLSETGSHSKNIGKLSQYSNEECRLKDAQIHPVLHCCGKVMPGVKYR